MNSKQRPIATFFCNELNLGRQLIGGYALCDVLAFMLQHPRQNFGSVLPEFCQLLISHSNFLEITNNSIKIYRNLANSAAQNGDARQRFCRFQQ